MSGGSLPPRPMGTEEARGVVLAVDLIWNVRAKGIASKAALEWKIRKRCYFSVEKQCVLV